VRDEGGEEEVLFIENISGLVSLVQSGVLEIHPWGSLIDDVERPDRIVMDLDPGEDVAWESVIAGARELQDRLQGFGVASLVKTTGGKGLHVVVPFRPEAGWSEIKGFCHDLAHAMASDSPTRYIATGLQEGETRADLRRLSA
jgi:bifunctional non-homologous end joining protein LigD